MMENTNTQRRLQQGVYYGWVMLLTVSFTEMISCLHSWENAFPAIW
jgi:hypothetical protein